MKKRSLLLGTLLMSSAMAFGAGFQLNLQGVRQLAMGGTGTAVPWDASTIFYNPGGLTSIRSFQVYGSAFALMPRIRYVETPSGSYTADTKPRVYTPFNLYIASPVAYKSKLSLGLGVYTPFGSGVTWDDDWRGRYISQEIQLQTIFIQPTAAYKFTDNISFGAGFVYATGNVLVRRAVPLQDPGANDGSAKLEGAANGVGFNLGLHVKVTKQFYVGLNYRSQVNMKVKNGNASFVVPSALSSQFPYTKFQTSLTLPQVATFGLGWSPAKNLVLQFDANFVGWSSYDSLIFDYETNTSSLDDTRSARKYKNTVTLRLGGMYKFSDKISGMLGVAYDPTPVRDGFVSPELPDNDHIMTSAGITYKPAKRLTIMGVFEYVITPNRTSTLSEAGFKGIYQNKIINPGLGISYDF